MGKVLVQKHTTLCPLELIGEESGVCWNADTSDSNKNMNRGISCIESGHMRTAEFPQVYLVLDGYSARVIRELYTHIAGGPTRLQASTRYIDYENGFDFIIPQSIKEGTTAYVRYVTCMENTMKFLKQLEELGVPREDSANLLPLGMTTKIVLRTNLRNLIDMSRVRLCNRAYWEFRQLMKDIMKALSDYSNEWKYVVKNYFKVKCDICGYCDEKNSCGKRSSKVQIDEWINLGKNISN